LRHVVLERWSRGSSGLHRRDPRAKIFALLVLLVALATAGRAAAPLAAMLLAVLVAALIWARLPLAAAMARAAVVFSFTIPFAILSLFAGESGRAVALLLKSYISALAVIVVVGTTPVPILLRGLEFAGVPRFLLMVAQFLYRYRFVIAEEAYRMRKAALSRGGSARSMIARAGRFRAAAGAVGALFSRSYARAEEIHRAMLARGFSGRLPSMITPRFTATDALFAMLSAAAILLARFAAERLAI
jgi:cobalt/nickel transport system permease protein